MRTPGILTINALTADQSVASSTVPVPIQNSATDQFTIHIPAGGKVYWELVGVFSLGATGGFRFLGHSSAAPTTYQFQALVEDLTTPAQYHPASAGVLAEAAFANASAVASNYTITASGFIQANAATDFTFEFAQNTSDVLPITMKAGTTIKFWQL